MRRRNFLIGALSAPCGLAIGYALADVPATIPFPRELGLAPLPVPHNLNSFGNKFPVPAGYYVYAWAQCNAEQENIARDATVEQWQQDGASIIQTVTAAYRRKEQTGISNDAFFAPVDTPTWIVVKYPVGGLERSVYTVSKDSSIIRYDASYNQGEGVFRIIYSKEKPKI